MGSVTTVWGTGYKTMIAHIVVLPTENEVTLDIKEFDVISSYLLSVVCNETTGVIANTNIISSEIEKIRNAEVVLVKVELPEGEYTFSCSKNNVNDNLITLVGSQVYGLDGFWTNSSKILSLTIAIDATS